MRSKRERTTSAPRRSISTVTVMPVLAGDQRAGAVGQDLRQHRLDRAGHVDARRAAVGLAIDRRRRGARSADTSAMWTQTRTMPSPRSSALIASSKSRALAGSIVNVGRSRRSRRSRSSACGCCDASAAARSTPGGKRRCEAAVEHQRLDHDARVVGLAEHARDLRAPTAAAALAQLDEIAGPGLAVALDGDVAPASGLEERRGDEEAPAALQQRDGHFVLAASTENALASCSSRGVLGSSATRTLGTMPGARLDPAGAEVGPVGREVVADRDVQRAAVGELA